MPNEIDLLRTYRADTPGPSAVTRARVQAAIDAAAARERGGLRGRLAALPAKRALIAAAVVALIAGALAIALPPGASPLTKPLTTAWQAARPLPPGQSGPAGQSDGWRLASYLVPSGWQENTAGPEPGYLTCPTAQTCYVEGNNASSITGPADMDAFYVTDDDAATWSVLPLPGGLQFTSALACGSAQSCAAGGLYHGGPVFASTADGGHSWTLDPLPAADGQIFELSCVSATRCTGLASATGKPIAFGFSALMAAVRVVSTTDGGRHFTAVRFPAGQSLQAVSCPTTSDCVAVGVYDASVQSRAAPINGYLEISRDGGARWRQAALPAGLSPGPFPQVTCSSDADCWMIGYVHDVAYSVLASSSDGGLTWTEHHLPATIPDPQLFTLACPTAASCYAAGEDSVPQRVGSGYNEGSAVVAVTKDGGRTWSRVSFPVPARVPGGLQADSFLAIGSIQCPQPGHCVALGSSDQGSTSTPVYTSNP